jgi:primosomal protein N'
MNILSGFVGKIFYILIGVLLIQNGCGNFLIWKSSNNNAEPIQLEDIENSNAVNSKFIQIGEHIRLYEEAVVNYNKETGSITHAYYPIMSKNAYKMYKANKTSGALTQEEIDALLNGKKSEAETEKHTHSNDFAILVQTDQFKTMQEAREFSTKYQALDAKEINGIVTNDLGDISTAEANLIKESFPNLNTSKLILLEENGKPPSLFLSIVKIIGGALILALSTMSIFGFFKEEAKKENTQH